MCSIITRLMKNILERISKKSVMKWKYYPSICRNDKRKQWKYQVRSGGLKIDTWTWDLQCAIVITMGPQYMMWCLKTETNWTSRTNFVRIINIQYYRSLFSERVLPSLMQQTDPKQKFVKMSLVFQVSLSKPPIYLHAWNFMCH
jgi:hypothetical protein